jgi:hypothetical protein
MLTHFRLLNWTAAQTNLATGVHFLKLGGTELVAYSGDADHSFQFDGDHYSE